MNRRDVLALAVGTTLGAVVSPLAGVACPGCAGARWRWLRSGHIGVIRALEKHGLKPDLVGPGAPAAWSARFTQPV